MPNRPQLILGTAGHIDHGKSALVRALTGTDTDRLAEEKRRGITIEIGFAQITLPNRNTMGVVDVPGHERFVRQMISGATGIDVALLCIAADDGIMPQTKEHLDILQLLGIQACVVAITKADLVDAEWLEFVTSDISAYLASSPYADAPIIACSSKTGQGLEEIKSALEQVIGSHVKQKRGAHARLPVDRVFSIKGSGTVVTGTLWSGKITQDDEIAILPSGKTTRVRSIQIHDTAHETAEAGNRVALNLNSVTVDDVRPGDFLVAPNSVTPTDRFDALYTHLDSGSQTKPLKSGTRVRLAHGTKEVLARLLVIDSDEPLKAKDRVRVQFRLEAPLAVSRNDHFVVRSYSPVHVIGGGTVLLAHPKRRTQLSKAEQELFDALEQQDENAIVSCAVNTKHGSFTAGSIAGDFEIPLPVVEKALGSLIKSKAVTPLEDAEDSLWFIRAQDLQKMYGKLENILMAFHSEHTDEAGITKSALLHRFGTRIEERAFDAFLRRAEAAGKIVEHRGIVSHPQIGAGISQKEEKTAEALHAILTAAATTPPQINDMVAEAKIDKSLAARALASLEEEGHITHINKDYYFDSKVYEQLKEKVFNHIRQNGLSLAADLKNAMGVSRKYAIPLLEHLDAQGVTRREGEGRILAE